ncbi:hypothetical protein DFH07DRAFT_946702 [Mycena maculata]|uniref:Uncharacterized protein n=1 Tax=Mycena maculata TaxID=230809 RepID=A0AAD7HJZ5_9AGAR|nr:hypothetical protein DFH07DRAFT_946702 [Mycena maculata]
MVTFNATQFPCVEANPDISGLGVRISFYLQTIALVLLAGRSLEEALNSVWTLLGTSFGLTVSALVTAASNQLPLYQAIIVTDLVWLANFAIFMALATYNRHPRGSHTVQYVAIGQTYVSMAILLYLWARAEALELEQPTRRGTIFVVLFFSTSATGAGRTVALAMTTLLLVGYTVVACIFLWRHPPVRHPHGRTPRASTPPIPLTPLTPPVAPAAPARQAGASNRLPPSLAIDPHLATLSAVFVVPYVITVACTELQLKRSPLCSDINVWGFGQVLAMAVTIVPLFITFGAFRKYGWKQRAREHGKADAHVAVHGRPDVHADAHGHV